MFTCNYFSLTLIISVTLTTIFIEMGSASYLPCQKCHTEEECNRPPTGNVCFWGENKDYCGRRVCSKGPGEKCGDKFDVLGICGEGMWCSRKDNRCYGCHIGTMECYPEQ